MNKTKLVLRSLLLMLVLWAVNAVVLKWPVHIDLNAGAVTSNDHLVPTAKARQTQKAAADLPLHIERGNVRVRSVPVE